MKVFDKKRPMMLATLGGVVVLLSPLVAVASPQPQPACGTRTINVYFAQWKSELGPDGREALTAAQQSFNGCVIEHVRIVGLAGIKGVPSDNLELSKKRADAVADFLTAGGWQRDRLELIARGDQGATREDAERPIRRRVRVTVQSRIAE